MASTDPQTDEPAPRAFPWMPAAITAVALGLIGIGVLTLRNRTAEGGGARASEGSTAKLANVRIEDLPLPAPPERYTPETPATPKPVGPAEHVVVGQIYTFTSSMNQPTMSITTTEEWTVRAVIQGDHVLYDIKTTTQVKMKNPPAGMRPMRPNISNRRGLRYPLRDQKSRGVRFGRLGRRVVRSSAKPIGEETIEVSTYLFDCEIYLSSGVKSWVTKQFPGVVKMNSSRMTRTLTAITGPRR